MSAFNEIYDLFLELIDDMSFVQKQIGGQKAALARRILITQLFSQMETIGYLLATAVQTEFAENRYQGRITFDDYLASLDDDVVLKDNGDPDVRPKKHRMLAHILFSLKLTAKHLDRPYDPFTVTGWESVKTANKIRDRLTHPKSKADLEVSNDENRTVALAVRWFLISLVQLIGIDERWIAKTQELAPSLFDERMASVLAQRYPKL